MNSGLCVKNDCPAKVNDFLFFMETIKGKSPKTIDEYKIDLKMFFRFMLLHKKQVSGDTEFDKIDVSVIDVPFIKTIGIGDIYAFLQYLSRDRHNNASTRARKVSCIRSFFKYLTVKERILDLNPADTLDSPKIRSSLPIYLTLEQSFDLLSAVDGPYRERDYAILVLFLNCGIRLSELVGINLSDIKEDTLKVLGKGNKERVLYLNEACHAAIAGYLPHRSTEGLKGADRNALFISKQNKRISIKTVQYLVKKYVNSAGLEGNKFSTHKLRHTAATLMYRNGVDVRALQEILGHTQLSTTQIYTHVTADSIKAAIDKNPLAKVKQRKPKKTIEEEK